MVPKGIGFGFCFYFGLIIFIFFLLLLFLSCFSFICLFGCRENSRDRESEREGDAETQQEREIESLREEVCGDGWPIWSPLITLLCQRGLSLSLSLSLSLGLRFSIICFWIDWKILFIAKVEFIGEDEMVEIVPNLRMDALNFIYVSFFFHLYPPVVYLYPKCNIYDLSFFLFLFKFLNAMAGGLWSILVGCSFVL
jgi:hypothetical protein